MFLLFINCVYSFLRQKKPRTKFLKAEKILGRDKEH